MSAALGPALLEACSSPASPSLLLTAAKPLPVLNQRLPPGPVMRNRGPSRGLSNSTSGSSLSVCTCSGSSCSSPGSPCEVRLITAQGADDPALSYLGLVTWGAPTGSGRGTGPVVGAAFDPPFVRRRGPTVARAPCRPNTLGHGLSATEGS